MFGMTLGKVLLNIYFYYLIFLKTVLKPPHRHQKYIDMLAISIVRKLGEKIANEHVRNDIRTDTLSTGFQSRF